MKIKVVPYNKEWPKLFQQLKEEIWGVLVDLQPVIEHIGSTSVPGLAAKPIIDISVGLKNHDDLDKTIKPMMAHHYIYYEVFNEGMPDRRLYVKLKDGHHLHFPDKFSAGVNIPHDKINDVRIAHVHIWVYGTPSWDRHIAFREYLKAHPKVKQEYENIKLGLSKKDWEHGMAYNDGKNDFIKREEAKAIEWYKTKTIN